MLVLRAKVARMEEMSETRIFDSIGFGCIWILELWVEA